MKMNLDPNPEEKRRTPLTILSNLMTKMKMRTKTTKKNPIMFKMALSPYLDLTFQKFIKNFFVEENNSFVSF